MNLDETVLCGNSSTGITQTTCGKLNLYAADSKVLSVEYGLLQIYARISRVKGSDITAANILTMPSNGTLFHVLGDTAIQHISTAGWSAGSAVVLIFKGVPNVMNNATSPPADTAPILLNANNDFQTQVNSTLSLAYDGEAWFETGRKI